jgi:N-acetylornithine carbamoyltransferase
MKSFYDLAELSLEQVNELLALAYRLQQKPEPRALEGRVLSLLFLSPSLRTLASFQAAMARLGGGTFVISPDKSVHALETASGIVMDGMAAEHIREAVPVIASYGDVMGIRVFAERRNLQADLSDNTYRSMAALVGKPLINMESAAAHPCQSLADWKTMNELDVPCNGGRFVLTWTYHPQALPLSGVISTIQMAAMRGMDVTVVRPQGFELPHSVLEKTRQIAARAGGSIRETDDRSEAMRGAHVVYAREWSSTAQYGNLSADQKLRNNLTDWCVDEPWFRDASDQCRLMHAMPVRRCVSVHDRTLDSPRSVIIQQAANRMWTQMAVLHRMLRS